MPLPVADLFEVLTVLSDVLFVLDEFVVHLLDQVSTLVAQLRQMHDDIFYQNHRCTAFPAYSAGYTDNATESGTYRFGAVFDVYDYVAGVHPDQ